MGEDLDCSGGITGPFGDECTAGGEALWWCGGLEVEGLDVGSKEGVVEYG